MLLYLAPKYSPYYTTVIGVLWETNTQSSNFGGKWMNDIIQECGLCCMEIHFVSHFYYGQDMFVANQQCESVCVFNI